MGKRRYFYFVIGIVLLAAFSITGISLLISSPALYVENIKISKEEAEFFVSEEKSASYAYFAGKYNADTSVSSFRNTQFDGITPEEYARERALKNILFVVFISMIFLFVCCNTTTNKNIIETEISDFLSLIFFCLCHLLDSCLACLIL